MDPPTYLNFSPTHPKFQPPPVSQKLKGRSGRRGRQQPSTEQAPALARERVEGFEVGVEERFALEGTLGV